MALRLNINLWFLIVNDLVPELEDVISLSRTSRFFRTIAHLRRVPLGWVRHPRILRNMHGEGAWPGVKVDPVMSNHLVHRQGRVDFVRHSRTMAPYLGAEELRAFCREVLVPHGIALEEPCERLVAAGLLRVPGLRLATMARDAFSLLALLQAACLADGFAEVESLLVVDLNAAAPAFKAIGVLLSLKHLTVDGCSGLPVPPASLQLLTGLEELHFKACPDLERLPRRSQFQRLAALAKLSFSSCSALTRVDTIGHLPALAELRFNKCSSLTTLPDSVCRLASLTRLELVGCQRLASLPEAIGDLPALADLALAELNLVELPVGIGRLRALTKLSLKDCQRLTALPGSLGDLAALEELSISDCGTLAALPESLGRLPRLSSLSVKFSPGPLPNSIGDLPALTTLVYIRLAGAGPAYDASLEASPLVPPSLARSASLRTLELSARNTPIPRTVTALTHLETLTLVRFAPENFAAFDNPVGLQRLRTMEVALGPTDLNPPVRVRIGPLPALESLTLDSRGPQPADFGLLPRLVHLNCVTCFELPATLGRATTLRSLMVNLYQDPDDDEELLEGIGGLVALESLEVRGEYASFPDALCGLAALSSLHVAVFTLEQLPADLGRLTALRRLSVQSMRLERLPDSLGQLAALTSLELGVDDDWMDDVDAEANLAELRALPECIGDLRALTSLTVYGLNRLETLPASIGELRALTHLDVHNCLAFNKLPDSIGSLGALLSLVLDKCPVVPALPDSIGRLARLRKLSLAQCAALRTLPPTMAGLIALTSLNLDRCDALSPPSLCAAVTSLPALVRLIAPSGLSDVLAD